MYDKFYVKSIIRDDDERFNFDAQEVYLSSDNTMLVRPSIDSTDVQYTNANGGEMIKQRLSIHEQAFAGIVYPRTTDYWTLYHRLVGFFQINHYYTIVYTRRDGTLFSQRNAWLSQNLQLPPLAREDYSNFTVSFKYQNSSLYEYTEDSSGNETYANSVTLPLLTLSIGGEEWDDVGTVWDDIGEVWSAGNGGVQSVTVESVSPVYPVWIVDTQCINPSLQNNTTDTVATYNGTVATGQTLVVDFANNTARLDGALVSRNVDGQVYFVPGDNIAGFNSDGGDATASIIKWNNVIG